ncbi:hypothetical protein HYU22_05900, partial [Candidatus Woesearchaeota archaeon]|nr:hypothetical protein [Candidatus Woesearchaeota archaeon]
MELVIDANVLFSLVIASKHSKLADIFFMKALRLSAPEHSQGERPPPVELYTGGMLRLRARVARLRERKQSL